jgi:murein DD-endopeptidase
MRAEQSPASLPAAASPRLPAVNRRCRALSAAVLAWSLSLSGCAPFRAGLPPGPSGAPVPESSAGRTRPGLQDARGHALARDARAQVGRPYRYGGQDPGTGFDCSGLVSYVHRGQGLYVPRTAADQHRAARPLPRDALRPGDLVFFRIDSREVSHVGIYIGEGRFVHAPRSGRPVGEARLDERYYVERWAGAGTFN